MAPRHAADQLGEANVDALHDDDDGNVVFGVAPKGPFINYVRQACLTYHCYQVNYKH